MFNYFSCPTSFLEPFGGHMHNCMYFLLLSLIDVEVNIALLKEYNLSLTVHLWLQVGPSVAYDATSMNELRKWNEQYGEGGSRRKSPFGFWSSRKRIAVVVNSSRGGLNMISWSHEWDREKEGEQNEVTKRTGLSVSFNQKAWAAWRKLAVVWNTLRAKSLP